jgi:hypothetical protein
VKGADNPVRILGKRESKDPEFQKGYLKPIDEEPTGGHAECNGKICQRASAHYESSRYFKISTGQVL